MSAPSATLAASAGAAASSKPLDGRKFVTTVVNGAPFVVDERYTGIKYIGGGAYGMVCSAEDSVRLAAAPCRA